MKVDIPKDNYIKGIEINSDNIEVNFAEKKRIALMFISVNQNYWPYLKQVIEDCRTNFLPHHNVDYFVWSDMPEKDSPEYHALQGNQFFSKEQLVGTVDFLRSQKDIFVTDTEAIEWPAPTLMRYHLFLNQEEKLKEYDYVFYLDADMRVVQKISDEVLGEGLTCAEHPMYSLRKEYLPPYEPNKASKAYIPRLGMVVDEGGKPRFKPLYIAGGFQGGKADQFIKAMQVMKANIDEDFNKNYVAIWNDESHWNRYVFEHANPLDGHPTIVLSPSYIYPDSLIKEYYEPIWGKKYEQKIITLTKPFSLSKAGADDVNKFLGNTTAETFQCPTCKDSFGVPQGQKFQSLVECAGSGKPHQVNFVKA